MACSGKAGALNFGEAVNLVQKRARYMTEAVTPGSGLVAAILGLSEKDVRSVCQEAGSMGIVAPANFNSPGQTVIAGEKAAVEHAAELAKKRGAKRVMPLPVSVPVHTPLMQVAADRLKKDIDSKVDRSAEDSVKVGDTGISTTRLAQIGYAEINGNIVEVKSIDGFLNEKTPIIVSRITDGTIMVEKHRK